MLRPPFSRRCGTGMQRRGPADRCLLARLPGGVAHQRGDELPRLRQDPRRLGNEHPNIVPYKVFPTSDGHVILAVGNDSQFQKWCTFAGADDLGADPRYTTNPLRLENRETLYAAMPDYMSRKSTAEWIDGLAQVGVPCSPVNTIDQVFEDPQVQARGMRIEMPHATAGEGTVPLIANPLKMSATPPQYSSAAGAWTTYRRGLAGCTRHAGGRDRPPFRRRRDLSASDSCLRRMSRSSMRSPT